jgi:hypothetical protein
VEPSTSSLRLAEVLSEEYYQLHGIRISMPAETKKEFAPESVIGKEGEDEGGFPDRNSDRSFKVFREKRLLEWAQDLGFGAARPELPVRSETDKLTAILERKVADIYLIYQEEWVADGSLRPFTRGLLDEYKATYPKPRKAKRAPSAYSGSLESMDFGGPSGAMAPVASASVPAESYEVTAGHVPDEQRQLAEKLNRMVLEDIYPEYLERRDTSWLGVLYQAMFDKKQMALVLSGGGIRSGTFALGVVQGLAELNIGPKNFTFLSTVSGGGYLGGWLSAWMHQDGADEVAKQLKPGAGYPETPAPIRHLRTFSNYLSPMLGLFSADTWTLFSIYLRNLTINWLIIIPFLVGFTSLPWLMVTALNSKPNFGMVVGSFLFGAICMIMSDLFTKQNPPIIQGEQSFEPKLSWQDRGQQFFLMRCLVPGAIGIFSWSVSWYWFFYGTFPDAPVFFQNFHADVRSEWDFDLQWSTISGFFYLSLGFVLIEWLIFRLLEAIKIIPHRFISEKGKNRRGKELLCLIFAGVLSGLLLVSVFRVTPLYNSHEVSIYYTSLAFPVFLLTILFNGFIYEGLKSTFVEDAEREWTARYSAWFLIVAFGWAAVCSIILYGPVLVENLFKYVVTLGALTSYLTAYLGRKLAVNSKPEQKEGKQGALANVSLPTLALIALVILFICLSFLNISFLGKVKDLFEGSGSALSSVEASQQPWYYVLVVLAGMAFLCVGFAWAVDMNRFSLHALYRSRLIRAYLGASRPAGERRPDPFTGFDETDNIYMGDMMLDRKGRKVVPKPFHIVNVALNLVGGRNLAWQERKAASFTVSPLHAGSLLVGYRKTFHDQELQTKKLEEKKGKFYGGDRGISLGTAMTISGAAVSPNSGYNTSPLVAFFMTLFNLRLGWWLGNPGPTGNDTFYRSSPKWGLKPVLSEMFGQTDEVNKYVFLSDGGHFENLGLYEMALRRNRFMLLSDGSCDETGELEDLGNAIRKIRIDLGIHIDFPLGFDIHSRNESTKTDGKYWALGRVRYPENNPDMTPGTNGTFGERDGVLLYIKPGIYGKEPKDIFNYATTNNAFPHESTADQFFSESQFESYRALGIFAINQTNDDLYKTFGIHISDFLNTPPQEWKSKIIHALNRKKPGGIAARIFGFK